MEKPLIIEYRTFPFDWYEDHKIEINQNIRNISLEILNDSMCPCTFKYSEYINKHWEHKSICNVFNQYDIIRYLIENNIYYEITCSHITINKIVKIYNSIKRKEIDHG